MKDETWIDPQRVEDKDHNIRRETLPKKSLSPEQVTHRDFRDALGQFGTGITVVTVDTPDGPVGMTVNSFASVSLDPPLVLWSLAKSSHRYQAFYAASHFAIHVLDETCSELAMAFANNPSPFGQVEWYRGTHNLPMISNALARFECKRQIFHDGGDHTIIVGKVFGFARRKGKPLIFSQGRFGKFLAE